MDDPLNLIGKKLASYYEIKEKIGEGGMGLIYKGLDVGLNRPVAVKVLSAGLATDKSYVKRFLQEARSLAKLKHPNLIQIYYVGQEGSLFFFVTEFIEGCTLAEHIKKSGRLGTGQALSIFGKVMSALQTVHELGIIHRDIKPSNVMLEKGVGSASGRAILMDFGLAKEEGGAGFTSAGVVVGTPEYMAPEQAKGEAVDARTDIYSLAITLYQMLSGKLPFSGKSAIDILRRQCEEAAAPISRLVPEVPKGLEEVLLKALEKDGASRYQSLPEFAKALAAVVETPELRDLAMKAYPEGTTPTEFIDTKMAGGVEKEKSAGGHRLAAWVAGILIALLVVGAATKLSKRKGAKRPSALPVVQWSPEPGFELQGEEAKAKPRFIVILRNDRRYPLEKIKKETAGVVYRYIDAEDGNREKTVDEKEVKAVLQLPAK